MNNPYDIITQLFSPEGIVNGTFSLRLSGETKIIISQVDSKFLKDDNIYIRFPENRPIASINRLLKISVDVMGIRLGTTGGILELKYFPNIPFRYEWI